MSSSSKNALNILKEFCDADERYKVSWDVIRKELGWSMSTLHRQRKRSVIPVTHRARLAETFKLDPRWVAVPAGPPRSDDGAPWFPGRLAWVGSQTRMSLEELAYGPAFQIVSKKLRAENRARVPGAAMFGLIRLAREIDPEGLNAAYVAARED